MEWEMVLPPAGACFTSFTIYHVLPDLPEANDVASKYDLMDRTPCNATVLTHFTLAENVGVCINSQFFVTFNG
jgi:hypothetical protein